MNRMQCKPVADKMNSPLVTQDYFFPVVQVVAEPKFSGGDINDVTYNIGTDLTIGEEKGTYQLTLEIQSTQESEEKEKLNAYKIHLVVVGYFIVSPKWPDPERLVRINGASILFSAAREHLITITSRGPWKALMLPTVSFYEPPKKDEEKTTKPKSKRKSK